MIFKDYEVKPIKAFMLKRGDKFMLYQNLMNEENPPVFVVTGAFSHDVDAVAIDSGNTYTFGKNVPVVPVTVELTVSPTKEVIAHDCCCKKRSNY